jgi:hypothetical protein
MQKTLLGVALFKSKMQKTLQNTKVVLYDTFRAVATASVNNKS